MRISIRRLLMTGFGLAAVALVSTMLLSQWAMQSYRSAIELQNRGQQLVQQLEQVQTSATALLTEFAFALVQRDGDAVPTLRAMSEAFGEQRAALARSLERERAAAVRDYASAAARALAAFEHAERVFVDTLEPVARMSEDEAYRMPALAIANRDINPATMAIAGAAAQMVAIESQRPFGQRSDRRLASLQNLRLQAVAVTANIRGFIAFRTESFADNVRLAIDQLEREVASLAAQSAALDFEQTVLLDDIVEAVDTLKSAVPVLIEVHGSEDAYRDRALLTGTFAPLRAELGEAVAQLRAAIDDDIRLRTARADASAARVQWIAWAGVVVFFVALIVAGGFVIASIQRGLGGTIRALENLETGDADLTQRLSPNALAELDRIASGFNRFQARLSDTVRETRAAASALTPVAERLERQVETSLARLRAQRGDLETVAAAAQELGASAEEIARNSRLGADAADGAAQKVAAGLEAMGQTNRAMSGLLAQIEGASDTVQALGDSSRHITQVVKVIREIAEQTNLLALNAAIEAARAGEHGRGFAVVADEVRQLATRTQKSTEEIQEMIERLRRDAETAVGRMQQSVQDAETTMECTAEVNGGLRAIEAAVREITERTAENASATQQQSAVVDDIANNLQRASDALQAVLDALGEVGAEADRLGELQAATEAVLGRFRV